MSVSFDAFPYSDKNSRMLELFKVACFIEYAPAFLKGNGNDRVEKGIFFIEVGKIAVVSVAKKSREDS